MNREYILLFIIGGLLMVVTKHITNNVSPKVGAILATVPIGLFSAYFIVEEDKLPKYLENYLKQIAFIVFTSILYLFLLQKGTIKHKSIYIMCVVLWVVFIIAQLYSK
jgi:hypothetical protein